MAKTHLHALPKGHQLDGYQIDAVLGAGGFGITYLAHEVEIERAVAIKEYLPIGIAGRGSDSLTVHPVSDEDREDFEYGLARFRDEARTLVNFRHPNIVTVHRFFQANGSAYLVMEYVEGMSLGEILQRDGALQESEIEEILHPLLDGLREVHAAGFLHRDIKPANIYVRSSGSPILLDFGSARLALGEKSRTLTAIVSSGYAPFEQYSSRAKQGPWSDIYGIGATLYHAITGAPPPEATDRIDHDDLVPAVEAGRGSYSEGLLKAVDAALALKGADRPQSIADFLSILGEETVAATTSGAPDPTPPADRTVHPARAAEPPAEADNLTIKPPEAPAPPVTEPEPALAANAEGSSDGARRSGGPSAKQWLIGLAIVVVLGGGEVWGWTAYEDEQRRQAAEEAQRKAMRVVAANQAAAERLRNGAIFGKWCTTHAKYGEYTLVINKTYAVQTWKKAPPSIPRVNTYQITKWEIKDGKVHMHNTWKFGNQKFITVFSDFGREYKSMRSHKVYVEELKIWMDRNHFYWRC